MEDATRCEQQLEPAKLSDMARDALKKAAKAECEAAAADDEAEHILAVWTNADALARESMAEARASLMEAAIVEKERAERAKTEADQAWAKATRAEAARAAAEDAMLTWAKVVNVHKARAAAAEAGVEDSSSHHMAYLKRIFLYSVFFASYPRSHCVRT